MLRARAQGQLANNRGANVDPSDVAQDVLLVATRKFSEFRGQNTRTFLGWLYGILDNRILQLLRPRGRRRVTAWGRMPDLRSWSGAQEPADSGTSVATQLSDAEEMERLARAASWCRQEDLTVISMRLDDGLEHEAIAAKLGITLPAARQRYCRALHRVALARNLLTLMSEHGINGLQQDAIGLSRFQGADPEEIANRFKLPPELVALWISQADELFPQS
jgi:RNA polymerase sigma factor (sigma-70 family)